MRPSNRLGWLYYSTCKHVCQQYFARICTYIKKSRKAEALRELLYLYNYLFIRQLLDALVKTRRRPAGHDADVGSVLILLGAVTILIKLL